MIHSGHLAGLLRRVAELKAAGGQLHHNSQLPDLPGNFIAPTLISGVSSTAAQSEIFGPIGTLHPYETFQFFCNTRVVGVEGPLPF